MQPEAVLKAGEDRTWSGRRSLPTAMAAPRGALADAPRSSRPLTRPSVRITCSMALPRPSTLGRELPDLDHIEALALVAEACASCGDADGQRGLGVTPAQCARAGIGPSCSRCTPFHGCMMGQPRTPVQQLRSIDGLDDFDGGRRAERLKLSPCFHHVNRIQHGDTIAVSLAGSLAANSRYSCQPLVRVTQRLLGLKRYGHGPHGAHEHKRGSDRRCVECPNRNPKGRHTARQRHTAPIITSVLSNQSHSQKRFSQSRCCLRGKMYDVLRDARDGCEAMRGSRWAFYGVCVRGTASSMYVIPTC